MDKNRVRGGDGWSERAMDREAAMTETQST
jgi:hypothetical protein